MRSRWLVPYALALGLLGCKNAAPDPTPELEPGESGIRGRVPVGEDSWAPEPGESICAPRHLDPAEPVCAKVGLDGSFALALSPGIYQLCRGHSCPSQCTFSVSAGTVTELGPDDFLTPKPDDQGFYGSSQASRPLPRGYVDMRRPLRVCVGPPDTRFRAPVSELTCTETDRCGRYVLSVPEGDYRVLFAEIGEELAYDRQRCLYRVRTGRTFVIDRLDGREEWPRPPCPERSTDDPITDDEVRAAVREVAELDPDLVMGTVLHPELVAFTQRHMLAGSSMEQVAEALQVDSKWLLRLVGGHTASNAR